uniref:Ion_trans domain-containing protein n=1 Tax=Loa loa TaxID=7209 RepID=A0A1I7VZQ1_LOALO
MHLKQHDLILSDQTDSDEYERFGAHKFGDFRGLATVMRVVRIMRVARIFKLARYSSGLKSFGITVKTSLPELSMLILFLLTTVIFFSTLMYFAERDEPNTKFKSIPHAGWWCIVTMTTVGYGDYCPETLFGKLIASCASISGVLVLAFPITMIVENFSRNYDSERQYFKRIQRQRRMAKTYD